MNYPNYPFSIEEAEEDADTTWLELDNKKVLLCVVPMLHPTMLDACGDFEEDITSAEIYGILRSQDILRILLVETEPLCIAIEFHLSNFGYEEPPLYYSMTSDAWSNFVGFYCKNVTEDVQLDWRKFGF